MKYKSNLKDCYEIKELLKNILIELGFDVEENYSSKSDSKYLTITNWRNTVGKGNDELYLRISNHDLPPTYSNNYYDFDLKAKTDNRNGDNGSALFYGDFIDFVLDKLENIKVENKYDFVKNNNFLEFASEYFLKMNNRELSWKIDDLIEMKQLNRKKIM